jgi:hypothetical protein
MPRLAVTVWLATGIWRWGSDFMGSNMDTLVRAGTLFAAVDPGLGADLGDGFGIDCDDYIDDPTAPEVLRKYLEFARAPAHGAFLPKPHPTLYADYEGKRVRVTMASRLGDVGITTDLDREFGYERRVLVSQLENFAETP